MKRFCKNNYCGLFLSCVANPVPVYTEPMWGLSMNLCLPYATVYMLIRFKRHTGGHYHINLHVFSNDFCILSGALIDKMGLQEEYHGI